MLSVEWMQWISCQRPPIKVCSASSTWPHSKWYTTTSSGLTPPDPTNTQLNSKLPNWWILMREYKNPIYSIFGSGTAQNVFLKSSSKINICFIEGPLRWTWGNNSIYPTQWSHARSARPEESMVQNQQPDALEHNQSLRTKDERKQSLWPSAWGMVDRVDIRCGKMDSLALFLFRLGPNRGAGTMLRDVFKSPFPCYQTQALAYMEVSVFFLLSFRIENNLNCAATTDSKLLWISKHQ